MYYPFGTRRGPGGHNLANMSEEIHDTLRGAEGSPEEAARKTAKAVTATGDRLAALDAKMDTKIAAVDAKLDAIGTENPA
jgi:hypothetical protein